MYIQNIPIADIKPYANNPRKNENAVDAVANSIKEFGFKVPLVIDKNHEIVTGHTRYLAAQKIELTEVPCIVADDLTKAQIKAFRLADNKTHELSEWDFDLLDAELKELFDFDMSDFGFDTIESSDFNTDFSLPDSERSPFTEMTFTFATEQAELVRYAI